MSAPEELRLEADGLRFGALAWGEPDAPLALLVHGYPDTAWTWRHLGPHLAAQGRRAVAPFTRGYGPTDLAPDDSYRVSDQARDVLALRDALGGDERAVLVGHDWGATAAYHVAQVAPERFARYVTLAVPPVPTVLQPLRRGALGLAARQLRMSWYTAYNQLPGSELTLERLVPFLWRTWSPGYDAREDVARVLAALDTTARCRAAQRYYRTTLWGGLGDAVATVPKVPVLHLHGADDGCLQAEIAVRFPELLPPGSRHVVVPGAGHFLHLEAPEQVHAAIDAWL